MTLFRSFKYLQQIFLICLSMENFLKYVQIYKLQLFFYFKLF